MTGSWPPLRSCSTRPPKPVSYGKGCDADDTILALAGLWQLDPTSDWRGRAMRLYRLVIDGLRP